MMKKKLEYLSLCILFYLLLSMPTYAQQMGIGVEPTIVDIYLSDNRQKTYLPLRLSNPSDQDMIFVLSIEDDLADYIQYECLNGYWCKGREYLIPANTSRKDAVVVNILFVKKTNEDAEFESAIYVRGRPTDLQDGTLIVSPRIKVRVTIHQSSGEITTTTTAPSDTSDSTEILATTTTTTIFPDSEEEIIIEKDTTTTTTVSQEVTGDATQSGMNPLIIVSAIVIVVILAVGIYVWKEGLILILPFIMMFAMMPSTAYAYDLPMNVTVEEAPAPVEPYQLATGIIPIMIIAGLFLWFLRGLEEITFERLVGSLLTVIIAIALVGVLVGLI